MIETAPYLWDSDSDGLCDGNCSGKGEDLNLNGWRDQDAGGNWTETDALANDSDVDGILDGLEVNGSYCFAIETGCTAGASNNATRVLDPLNPDTDGDQLRDGQEVAGWKVATWREHTMEAIANWSVVSYPWDADSEDDLVSDFSEFQNGSDPFKEDTDGDTFLDRTELNDSYMNITGYYNIPPILRNWQVSKYKEGGVLPLFGSGHWVVQVEFDAWARYGIDHWQVIYGKPVFTAAQEAEFQALVVEYGAGKLLECQLGGDKEGYACQAFSELLGKRPLEGAVVGGNAGGNTTAHIVARFDATVEEAHIAGKWLEARVWDVYGLGVSRKEQVKSTLEKVVEFLTAIANAIAEALSALVAWIWDAIEWMLRAVMSPLGEQIGYMMRPFGEIVTGIYEEETSMSKSHGNGPYELPTKPGLDSLRRLVMTAITVVFVLQAIALMIRILLAVGSAGTSEAGSFALQFLGTAIALFLPMLALNWIISWTNPIGAGDPVVDWIAGSFPGGAESIGNQLRARSAVVAVIGFFLLLMKLFMDEAGTNSGLALVLVGLIIAASGLSSIWTHQPGQLVPLLAFAGALLGFLTALTGFYRWWTAGEYAAAQGIGAVLVAIEISLVATGFVSTGANLILATASLL